MEWCECVDAKSGETFEFHLTNPEHPWFWQRRVLDGWLDHDKHVILKARQLGVTWLAAGLGLWTLLYRPGTRVLVVSINETEASKVVNRLWDMLQSLPAVLRNGAKVIKPSRGARPYTSIDLRFPDGRISSVLALASTKTAGHGETAALVILDEYARQEYARDTWNAVVPTMADGGRLIVVSTANGVSSGDDEGNFFHYLWKNHVELGVHREFLGWQTHPGRTQEWYDSLSMPARQKAEQYPDDPDEAFLLTGDQYFDVEALFWYGRNALSTETFAGEFVAKGSKATLTRKPNGIVRVYHDPAKDGRYAIGADVATGRGRDFSCAYVVSLDEMRVCAEIHGKLDADRYAEQLHFLGRWFNDARLAVEMGGGYGEAVIIPLRDGVSGRPPYRALYRHRQDTRIDLPGAKQIGFPMTMKTRPLVLSQLEQAVRERDLPDLPESLLSELHTFVYAKTNPSPRAQEGANDDRVMALAVALEMFRRYGRHANRWTPDRVERKVTTKVRLDAKGFAKRYGKARVRA